MTNVSDNKYNKKNYHIIKIIQLSNNQFWFQEPQYQYSEQKMMNKL